MKEILPNICITSMSEGEGDQTGEPYRSVKFLIKGEKVCDWFRGMSENVLIWHDCVEKHYEDNKLQQYGITLQFYNKEKWKEFNETIERKRKLLKWQQL